MNAIIKILLQMLIVTKTLYNLLENSQMRKAESTIYKNMCNEKQNLIKKIQCNE